MKGAKIFIFTILRFSGYIECPNGCCEQPTSVGEALRLIMVPGPIIMLFISLVFIWYHPINEKRRLEIQDELINLRLIFLYSYCILEFS